MYDAPKTPFRQLLTLQLPLLPSMEDGKRRCGAGKGVGERGSTLNRG